jgi:hypothetical protein
VAVLCACLITLCVEAQSFVDPKTSHSVFFSRFYRIKVSDRSGLWPLFLPMLWLYFASSILGVFCWSYYAEGLVAIIQWINDSTKKDTFLSSSVVKRVFTSNYPVVLVL